MNAKDKAIELVDKFIFEHYATLDYAKQCAIICVNETIEALASVDYPISEHLTTPTIKFYKSVKTEIEKL